MTTHSGGCHCGAVRFTVDAPAALEVAECNCSICGMLGYWHLIVPRDAFALVGGREHLTSYRFNTGTAEHLFCNRCGVKSFYVPRSHPEGISVNARCLDRGTHVDRGEAVRRRQLGAARGGVAAALGLIDTEPLLGALQSGRLTAGLHHHDEGSADDDTPLAADCDARARSARFRVRARGGLGSLV